LEELFVAVASRVLAGPLQRRRRRRQQQQHQVEEEEEEEEEEEIDMRLGS
jgi:hypothetical protein